MRPESRPSPEELPPASGPKERRDEFLRARGLDEEGADHDRLSDPDPGDEVESSRPDNDAGSDPDAVPEQEPKDSNRGTLPCVEPAGKEQPEHS